MQSVTKTNNNLSPDAKWRAKPQRRAAFRKKIEFVASFQVLTDEPGQHGRGDTPPHSNYSTWYFQN